MPVVVTFVTFVTILIFAFAPAWQVSYGAMSGSETSNFNVKIMTFENHCFCYFQTFRLSEVFRYISRCSAFLFVQMELTNFSQQEKQSSRKIMDNLHLPVVGACWFRPTCPNSNLVSMAIDPVQKGTILSVLSTYYSLIDQWNTSEIIVFVFKHVIFSNKSWFPTVISDNTPPCHKVWSSKSTRHKLNSIPSGKLT